MDNSMDTDPPANSQVASQSHTPRPGAMESPAKHGRSSAASPAFSTNSSPGADNDR